MYMQCGCFPFILECELEEEQSLGSICYSPSCTGLFQSVKYLLCF